jgi:hypothetical protein
MVVEGTGASLDAGVVRVVTIDCHAPGGIREFDVFSANLVCPKHRA